MTNEQILRDIISSYDSSTEWQSDIAKRYGTTKQVISKILQKCDFHYHKKENNESVDDMVRKALNNKEIVELCDKITKNS